jgi:outer membrane lipoprotein-sorting protein
MPAFLLLSTLLLLCPIQDAEPFEAASHLLLQMQDANRNIADMRCLFTMEITKDGHVLPVQHTILRYRSHPEIIHLTFLEPHEGRKVVYRKDENGGTMRVRPDGFWGFFTLRLDPLGRRAMEEAIDPITAQGFPNIVTAAERLLQSARAAGHAQVHVDTLPSTTGLAPTIRLLFQTGDSLETSLEVDARTFLPARISKRDRANAAVYRYENIEVNPGIPEEEFVL